MGAVTHGDVLAGLAAPEELVPFGGPTPTRRSRSRSASSCSSAPSPAPSTARSSSSRGPEHDPVPAFRALAAGSGLPGDSLRDLV